jgi:hypothetical protein
MDSFGFIIAFSISLLITSAIDLLNIGTKDTAPSFTITLNYDLSFNECMRIVSRYIANQTKYRIDYYDFENGKIVLNERLSFFHIGFLYTIQVSGNQGKSTIVIGISSKFPTIGEWANKQVKLQLRGVANIIMAGFYAENNGDSPSST